MNRNFITDLPRKDLIDSKMMIVGKDQEEAKKEGSVEKSEVQRAVELT
jgi:hypothetical protein